MFYEKYVHKYLMKIFNKIFKVVVPFNVTIITISLISFIILKHYFTCISKLSNIQCKSNII